MTVGKSTKHIIEGLRRREKTVRQISQAFSTFTDFRALRDAADLMKEAADRLEKATMTDAFAFSADKVIGAELKWKVGYRAGIEAFRDAIADGSVDDLVTK